VELGINRALKIIHEERMKKDDAEELKKLIDAHWLYIRKLLDVHGESPEVISKIKFHYKTAFEHGWKHGKES